MLHPPRLDDPAYVRDEYADDAHLSARAALWAARAGPQPLDIALQRIVALGPAAALEVGCGRGEFAAALRARGVDVTAIDQSAHMVELTAARGVRARRADVQSLPFDDGGFDVVAANYMLYHVPDLPRALSEIVRVLRPGGALVAVTNSERQLRELWDLVGRGGRELAFSSENGAELLGRHFASVTREDVEERFRVSAAAIRDYLRAGRFAALARGLPDLPDGLAVTAAGSVFVAAKAAQV